MANNPNDLRINFKFWIETTEGLSILGEGKWQLLKAIKEHGSLKSAIQKMGYSYRQTWDNLRKIEEKLQVKLIDKSRGGEKGGQTVLTPQGEKLVDFFDHLYNETEPYFREKSEKMQIELRKIFES